MKHDLFETASLDRAAFLAMLGVKPVDTKPAMTDPRRRVWLFERTDRLRDANRDFSGEANEASVVKAFITARTQMLDFAYGDKRNGTPQ